ncbi:MAG: carbamoyl-phosphate synthase large subunit [Bacteroidales bacterium]|jgi:carbamoyl-phosphate synthase large subunit|nr:carbamoyl-phosphate synthase large subunit [Bacteroidales bacterium]MDN5328310.1 carbamoyl-phosphate synthase large subunit [Bacteroidales bacterium]
MNKTIHIALSGLNAVDSPGPGVPVARGLREASGFDFKIIGLAYENLEPGIYIPGIADKVFTMPYPSEGIAALKERWEYILSVSKPDVVIPNFDAELLPYIRLNQWLKERGVASFLPTEEQFEERQKYKLTEFGEKYNIPVPESHSVNNLSELAEKGKHLGYPLVVKGKFYEAGIARSLQEAEDWFLKISYKWGFPIIVQKYIKGEEFNVAGLGDGNGETIAAVAMRKQYITDKGKAWGGITVTDPQIMELTRHFVSKTQWRGPFELELMKDARGDFHVMEINPRMPAWIYLAVAAGQNIPLATTQLAQGEEVKPMPSYEPGIMFIRYSWDLITHVSSFQKFSMKGER